MTETIHIPAGSPWTRLRAVAADIKLHHSVFALPWAILATVLAAHRAVGMRWGQLLLVLICMVSARTVAMVANRVLDADVDIKNPRTARRAVPAGRVSAAFAWVVLLAASVVFVAAAAGFALLYKNPWPAILSVPVLLFVIGYSLTKRFTWLCHYYLGVALALAPVCSWLAIAGSLSSPPLWMAAAVVCWLAGFDILYACQDYAFDVAHGLFSVPSRIGIARAMWVARLTHVACIGCLVGLAVTTPELHVLFFIGIGITAVLMTVEHSVVSPTDLSRLTLAFFTLNGVIGLLLGTLGVIDIVYFTVARVPGP
jgi:4-hydroxybenzoate polyprenyltransferase